MNPKNISLIYKSPHPIVRERNSISRIAKLYEQQKKFLWTVFEELNWENL